MHYFTKVDPRISVTLSDGRRVTFTAVNRDTGIYGTEDQGVANELDKAIQGKRGGVARVDAQAFKDLVEKKTPEPFKRNWRDEIDSTSFRTPAASQPNSPAPAVAAVSTRPLDGAASQEAVHVNPIRPSARR